jgi:hypothetical protein
MVFFGLISYSLYLWHWPLLAIDRVTRAGPAPAGVRGFLVAVAVVAAWLSYRFVERPFRRADPNASDRAMVFSGLAASASLAVAALVSGNSLDRLPPPTDLASVTARDMPANRHRCHYSGYETLESFPKPHCVSPHGKPVRVAIWGDSMALAWQPFAWEIAQRSGGAAVSFTRDACPPMLDFSNGKHPREAELCREFNARVLAEIPKINVLVLSAGWNSYLHGGAGQASRHADLDRSLRETLAKLTRRAGQIIILGPTPRLRDTAPRCMATSGLDTCAVDRKEFDSGVAETRKLLASISSAYPEVVYVDPVDFFCTPDLCPVLKNGYGLYWDAYHVSSTAARNFAKEYLVNNRN